MLRAKYLWEVGVVKQILWRFSKDDSGISTIEYGLIAGFVSMAIISILSSMGDSTSSLISKSSSDFQSAVSGAAVAGGNSGSGDEGKGKEEGKGKR